MKRNYLEEHVMASSLYRESYIHLLLFVALILPFLATGCAGHGSPVTEAPAAAPSAASAPPPSADLSPPSRPGVTWAPDFRLQDVPVKTNDARLPALKVGADIRSENGRVCLHEVITGLADLKGMNVSWASDVDQDANVDVNIKAEDDFWTALSNTLRQLDYGYAFKDNTIIVKYKETRKYTIPVPFLSGSYKTSVGGDLLGSEETAGDLIKGTVAVEHQDDKIHLWTSIETNLQKILNLATTQVAREDTGIPPEEEARIQELCSQQFPSRPAQQALCVQTETAKLKLQKPAETEPKAAAQQATAGGKETKGEREGYYFTIDKPLGIVSVTAPRSVLEKVDTYFDALKEELSRQVVIDAKIIEVHLTQDSRTGIDWTELLKNSAFGVSTFTPVFGSTTTEGIRLISQARVTKESFNVFLNFLGEHGNVKVLSNPKLSLMNGQPALITIGENVRYIDTVDTTIDAETGIITYSVETNNILSGIGFGVSASIASDEEVIIHLTPVTTELAEPIEYKEFGTLGAQVGLPRVQIRELTTMARVKTGNMLVVGGLIDEVKGTEGNKVPILGDLPIVGNAFKSTREYSNKRELIILLRPEIVHI